MKKRRSNSDEDLRHLERKARGGDPVASRKARELRIRLGGPRPSDLILEKLPEEARLAFDRDQDWSDRIYLPHPPFAPGEPSELEVIWEPEGPGSPLEFYRRYYEEAYEVESSRWSSKGRPAVIGETHVYSEANGIWEGLGSDERRDVDETTVEELYGPAPGGRPRNQNTRWLDRRMWMNSWEPYDEHVLDTGEDMLGAYDLPDLLDDPRGGAEFRRADRRRLAQCRLRALMWSSTTLEEYFALVGEAGLKWCNERPSQWHTFNPGKGRTVRANGGDEERRRRARESKLGGISEKVKILADRMRTGELSRLRVEIAADFGDPVAVEVTGRGPKEVAKGFDWLEETRPGPRRRAPVRLERVPVEWSALRWVREMRSLSAKLTDMPALVPSLACVVAVREFSLQERNGLDYRRHKEEMEEIWNCFERTSKIVSKLLDERPIDDKDRAILDRSRRSVTAIADRYDNNDGLNEEVDRVDEGMEEMPSSALDVMSLIDVVTGATGGSEVAILINAIDSITHGMPQEGEIRERVSDPLIAGIIKELIGPKKR